MLYILQVLGGLALFRYGIGLLSGGMEKLTGEHIQLWLDRLTNRPFKGAILGAVATAMIQSSSLLMVTMIGLINANLMTLEQSIGVMLGQEIGTTLTAQLAAFHVGNLCYLFIILGFILVEFVNRNGWRILGEIILGFGILFLGMNAMTGALKVVAQSPSVIAWLAEMGKNPMAGAFSGMLLTAAVQSSGAVTGLVVAMGMSNTITLPAAISIVFGANIGTCITGFIASFGLSKATRQASIAQIFINLIGVLLFMPFIAPFANLVNLTSANLARQIANSHTIFNVIVSLILFPFVKPIAGLTKRLVPEKTQATETHLTAYIDDRQLRIPQVALTEAYRELHRLGGVTAQMLEKSKQALLNCDIEAAEWVETQEQEFVDPVCKSLEKFVNVLLQGNLSTHQQQVCFQIKNLLVDVERVGDLAQDVAEAAQHRVKKKIEFSSKAMDDLERLCQHVYCTYTCALEALLAKDKTLARQVCLSEDEFDHLYLEARRRHIRRLRKRICTPEADVVFVETLRNLERISDHADNLGVSVSRN